MLIAEALFLVVVGPVAVWLLADDDGRGVGSMAKLGNWICKLCGRLNPFSWKRCAGCNQRRR